MEDERLQQEELFLFENPFSSKIQAICNRIYKALQLDFFGIDCNIKDDNELLIFEINATIKPFTSEQKRPSWQTRIHQLTHDRIIGASHGMLKKRLVNVRHTLFVSYATQKFAASDYAKSP